MSSQRMPICWVFLSCESALSHTLVKHINWLKQISTRLGSLYSQDALLLLRHCFSSPRIQHVLRGIFCGEHPLLHELDVVLRSLVMQILNTQLDDESWQQVTLPINSGGLSIRSIVDLSASAFMASLRGSASMVSYLLSNLTTYIQDPLEEKALALWSHQTGTTGLPTPSGPQIK